MGRYKLVKFSGKLALLASNFLDEEEFKLMHARSGRNIKPIAEFYEYADLGDFNFPITISYFFPVSMGQEYYARYYNDEYYLQVKKIKITKQGPKVTDAPASKLKLFDD